MRKIILYIKDWWYDFQYGIKNLIKWFLPVWKDRDWDGDYILRILAFKLKKQAKYFRETDRHTSSQRDAEQLELCVRLIDKLVNNYYFYEYCDYHKSHIDWGELEKRDEKSNQLYELRVIEIENWFEQYFEKYPRLYKKIINGQKRTVSKEGDMDKQKIAREIAYSLEEKTHRLLFKIIRDNINNWWN